MGAVYDLAGLRFEDAVAWAAKRGVVLPEVYYGVYQGIARASSFTVSGLTRLDQIQNVLDSLKFAIRAGSTFEQWRDSVDFEQFGLPKSRAELVFRNGVQSAYGAGRWKQIVQGSAFRPLVMYDAINDSRTRATHHAMDGFIAPVTDPVWSVWTPPNGHNCRCTIIALTEAQAKKRGWSGSTKSVPANPDIGWEYNPGDAYGNMLAWLEKKAKQQAAPALAKALEAWKAKLKADAAAAAKMIAKEVGATALARATDALQSDYLEWTLLKAKAGELGKWYAEAAKAIGGEAQTAAQIAAYAAQLKDAAIQKAAVGKWKANAIAGKKINVAMQSAFNALNAEQKAAVLAEVEAAKAKAAAAVKLEKAVEVKDSAAAVEAATDSAALDVSRWKQVGAQAGSNPGGLYEAPDGARWYLKFYRDPAMAHNEALAGRLYDLAGIDVPELRICRSGDQVGIASRIIEGLARDRAAITAGKVAGVFEGFGADAWLANWDITGLGFDNLMVKAGRAYRIDLGGSLTFRAQGGPKGALFGPSVKETVTLLDPAMNPNSAAAFSKMTKADKLASVARVLAIPPAEIRAACLEAGYGTAAERSALADLLISRQASLAQQFSEVPRVVAEAMKAAREAAALDAVNDLAILNEKVLEAIRGLRHQAKVGDIIREKDIARAAGVNKLMLEFTEKWAGRLEGNQHAEVMAHFRPWVDPINKAVSTGVRSKAKWAGSLEVFQPKTGPLSIHLDRSTRIDFVPGMFGGPVTYTDQKAGEIMAAAWGNFTSHMEIPAYAGSAVFASMPKNVVRSLVYWTGNGSGATVRILNGTALKSIRDYVDLVDHGLKTAPVKYKGPVARGLGGEYPDLIRQFKAELARAHQSGEILQMKVPSSWKRGKQPPWGDAIVLHIEKSTQGVHVDPISMHHGSGEDEVMMPRFLYRVLHIDRNHYYLEEVTV